MGRKPDNPREGLLDLIPDSQSPQEYLSGFRLVMFDLDDTLFEERLYLESAYREIARKFSGSDEEEHKYFQWLQETFETQGRRNLFQKFFNEFSLGDPDIPGLLDMLRNHKVAGGLTYFPWVPKVLEYIDVNCALVTNGNPRQQRNKLKQLAPKELTNRFDFFFFANEVAPKPSPKVFSLIQEAIGVDASQCLMVGDSDVDSDFAHSIGGHYLHVRSLELALGKSGVDFSSLDETK